MRYICGILSILALLAVTATTSHADKKPVHKVKGLHISLPEGLPLQDDGLVPGGTRTFQYHGASYRVGPDGYVELLKPAPRANAPLPPLTDGFASAHGPNRVSTPGSGYDLQRAIETQYADPYGYAQPYGYVPPAAAPAKGKTRAQTRGGYYVTAPQPPQQAGYYVTAPQQGPPAPQYAPQPQYQYVTPAQYPQPQAPPAQAPATVGSPNGINDNNFPQYGTPVGNGTVAPSYYYPNGGTYPQPQQVRR